MALSASRPAPRRAPFAPSPVAWVILLQFASLTALAAVLGTWQDEEYTLATTAHGVAYAFERAISYELQAPLYFALLAALRTLNATPLFARMLSVLAACALTFLAAKIARRVWPARNPTAFAALVAANPFVVYAGLEIRLYAVALAVSAGLWLAFDYGFLTQRRREARLALVLLAVAAVYLQYFLAFELIGFAIALVFLRRWRSLAQFVALMVPVGIAFVPLALRIRAQVGDVLGTPHAHPGAFGSVLIHPLLDFVLPLDYEAVLGRAGHVAAYVLLAGAVAALVLGRPRLGARAGAIVSIAAAIEALYALLGDILHYDLDAPRHFVALYVPEVVAVYAVVAAFRGPRAKRCAAALFCIVALAEATSLATTYRVLAKQGDWPRVGAMLSARSRPGDAIAVFEADGIPALQRYYHGPARLVPLPRAVAPDRYDVDALIVHSERDVTAALAPLPQNGRLWIVNFGTCNRFDFYGCLELRAAISRHYRVLERQAFFQNEVERVAPKSLKRAGAGNARANRSRA